MKNLEILIRELVKLPTETEWVEFKVNNYSPEVIGRTISALANAATYCYKNHAYLVFGVDDKTHEIVGTTFDYRTYKKGNEEIQNWLRQKLSDNVSFEFASEVIDGKNVVVIVINKAIEKTVMFEKEDFIRVGTYVKPLNDNPSMKTLLWDRLRSSRYEDLPAKEDLEKEAALKLLDYSAYFDLRNETVPTSQDGIVHYLVEEALILKQDNGLYTITNLGAILFAKKLSDFPTLSRKAIRVVQYKGNDKFEMLKEDTGLKGYAIGFEELLKFIGALLPTREVIVGATRKTETAYPDIAIREAVANAIIHQDLSISGTSPVVEVYANRVEITNPGKPLVDINRIIDNPPKSRNEKMASLMRRLKMCEELGTGWDKIAISCELKQLPAPKIWLYEENTKVTLFRFVPFAEMSPEDKIRGCYFHACLQHIKGETMTNSGLRERFGVSESSSASISRLIKECVEQKLIKPLDPNTAPKHMKYIPIWA
jgi:predicted HTH transcriptional regulator